MMINWDSDHPLLHAEMLGVRARALGASLLGRAAPTKAVAGKGGAAKKGAKVESKRSFHSEVECWRRSLGASTQLILLPTKPGSTGLAPLPLSLAPTPHPSC